MKIKSLRICEKTACLFFAGALLSSPLQASMLSVEGGLLDLGAGIIEASAFTLGPTAELRGNGTIDAPALLAGIITPGEDDASVGTIAFTDNVTFDSAIFRCHAASSENLDKILASGEVSGTASVIMSKAPAAIPLWQIIMEGGPNSSYSGFSVASPAEWQLGVTNDVQLTVTDWIGDTDEDGMPDHWEFTHFGGRTAADAHGDADNNGFINLHEYLAGTDPWNPESGLFLDPAFYSAEAHVIYWQSVAGKKYNVVGRTNLLSGQFELFQSGIVATENKTWWTNQTPGQETLYYRIQLDLNQGL